MIIEFSVGNFLSFKEISTISLVASSLKEKNTKEDDMIFGVGEVELPLLRSAVVYGANASGKSNFIKAIEFFKWFTINSSKEVQAGEKVDLESYKLSSETIDAPTYFECIFNIDNIQYRYGFEADNISIHREWLYQKQLIKRKKEIELFYREKDLFVLHSKFSVAKELVDKKMIRNNALLLSVTAQFNEPLSVNIMKWLGDTTIISSSHYKRIMESAVNYLDNSDIRERIVEFVRGADLGIEDIVKIDNTIISKHIQYNEDGAEIDQISFPFQKNESEGTVKYFSLAYPVIHALDSGGRLVIDEFDAKMHPVLTQNIVALFNSKETNPNNAQLLFTTHDTNLLNNTIFRRDQIWFTQKDNYGASKTYPLSDYKVRNDAILEKEYLQGKYGAIPIVSNLSQLFEKEV